MDQGSPIDGVRHADTQLPRQHPGDDRRVVAAEDDVRAAPQAVWKSTSELGYRVDGVGCAKFDFHTGHKPRPPRPGPRRAVHAPDAGAAVRGTYQYRHI